MAALQCVQAMAARHDGGKVGSREGGSEMVWRVGVEEPGLEGSSIFSRVTIPWSKASLALFFVVKYRSYDHGVLVKSRNNQ